MCWQHASTLGHRIRSLTRNQTFLFVIAIASVLIGIPGLYFSYVGSRNVPTPIRETLPTAEEQTIKVVITYVIANPASFWLVRNDVKQYFPADLFMMKRFTNLTNEEILVDSLVVEIIGRLGEAPFRIYPLPSPDEWWQTYCGPSKNLVVPCMIPNRGFLFDVLRQPIPAGHTVYAVGLFQLPQGRDRSHASGLNLHIIDMRGKRYDIGAILPTESDSDSLEQFGIRNGHPAIDISVYSEQRPFLAGGTP